jgi:NAD+ synthase (glutamine-hydrolysing)
MKISLAQLNAHIGHFEHNLALIRAAVARAREDGADIVVFPELTVTGYPPRDFLEFDDFVRQSRECIEALCAEARDIAIVVGAPTRNPRAEGKDLFNSAYFLADGKVLHVAHKALLPTYDVFDEYRYFEPATGFGTVLYKGMRIAVTVCEDIWNVGNENPLYTVCPLDELAKTGFDLVLNLSASPFSYRQAADRLHTVKANVARYKVPVFYVNYAGAQTELIFDGGSLVVSPDGCVYDEMPYFQTCQRTYELEAVQRGGVDRPRPKHKTALVHDALLVGIRDYFWKLGLKKAILGLSGGIDSAVVAVLAAEALGPENVRALLMPSQFSSDHSVNDARALAETLGIQYDIVPIQGIYGAFMDGLSNHFLGLPFGLAEENLQARTRGVLLMAMANKMGCILLNTSNKSEAAVGYGTLYGDMCGGLSVIGDLYKTEVYELARYLNRDGDRIPQSTLTKPPSAELRPGQKDSDSLPDYEVLDSILFAYIEERQGPRELVERGFEAALVQRVLRMVNANEFKRAQTPPILRVSPKAFGTGRRLPIVAKYLG